MKRIFITLCAAASFVACTTDVDQDVTSMDSNKVTISPSITRATDTSFEAGDQIGLSMTKASGESYLVNQTLTYEDGLFSASDVMWYTNSSETSTLMAYYPYSSLGEPTEFTVQSDQSTGYTASDLMFSVVSDVEPTAEAVGMVFQHKLSNLVISTVSTTYTVESIKIIGVNSTADVDVATESVKVQSDSQADITTLKSGEKFYAIVVPQTAIFNFEITVAGLDEPIEASTTLATLESGKQHSLTLYVIGSDTDITVGDDDDDDDDTWTGPLSVAFDKDYSGEYAITQGSLTIDFSVSGTNASKDDVVWSTSNDEVATVNDGVVTFQSWGEASITALYGDAEVSADITIPAGWWVETYSEYYSAVSSYYFGVNANTNTTTSNGYLTVTTTNAQTYSKSVTVDEVYHELDNCWRADVWCYNEAKCVLNANTYPYMVFHLDNNVVKNNVIYHEFGIRLDYSDGSYTSFTDENGDNYADSRMTPRFFEDGSIMLVYDMSYNSFYKTIITDDLTSELDSYDTPANISLNYFMYGYDNDTTIDDVVYPAMTDFSYNIYSIQTFASTEDIDAYIVTEGLIEIIE